MDAGLKELRALSGRLREVLSRRGEWPGAYGWFIRLCALRCVEARFPGKIKGDVHDGAGAMRAMRGAARVVPEMFGKLAELGRTLGRTPPGRAGVVDAIGLLFDSGSQEGLDRLLKAPTALGWLHQFWVDQDRVRVSAKLRRKAGDTIGGEDLFAATCVYTGEEHVRFLLQQSLGRLWVRARPDSRLRGVWRHVPADGDPGPAPFTSARGVRLIDPACGAGHFLLEALDMLFAMAIEEKPGSDPGAVCGWIMRHCLYGLDIDPRAVRIARAALAMRCMELGGSVPRVMRVLCAPARDRELGALRRPARAGSEWDRALTRRYHIVATNPPFVGFRKLAAPIKAYVARHDPLAASDLAVAFVSRSFAMLADGGMLAVVTPSSWTTSTQALALRRHILEHGGPRVVVSLGQRIFETAPLLFVSLAVIERGEAAGSCRVAHAEGGELDGVERRAQIVTRERLAQHPTLSFAAGAAVVPLHAGSGTWASTGDFFTFVDGLWTGDTGRDTREWADVEDGDREWVPASSGHGYCRWYGPVTRVVRAEAARGWAALDRREGCLEYSRVAGGKLAARMVLSRSVPIAGVVSMLAREGMGDRWSEVLAVFNSRVGTMWLRSLVSGLNFNPGYAARVPVPRDGVSEELRGRVREAVRLRQELARGRPGCQDFECAMEIEDRFALEKRLMRVEQEVDRTVADEMGIRERDLEGIRLPAQTVYESCVRRGMSEGEIRRALARDGARAAGGKPVGATVKR